jgi:predicted Zn finger-like uncharacterized protein
MSFITRCPACATAFKVVPDQLKISDGWVRCGQCQQVFDATLDLQPGWSGADTPTTLAAPAGNTVDQVEDIPVEPSLDGAAIDPVVAADVAPAELPAAEVPAVEAPVAPLSFVRQAQRRAFWHRTPVRVFMAGLACLLMVGLLAQWALWDRDHLAARSPGVRALLERVCAPLGCRVGDWQAPDMVHIDSSALLRRAPGRYVFDMVLKNTSPWPVALPAIELTLTDATDAVLVRRVLPPQDWSPHTLVVAGSTELPVRVELALPATEAQVMTGYRALLFYP